MKTIFAKRQALGLRFLVCVILSIFLMIIDHRHVPFFIRVRAILDWMVWPVHYGVDLPFRATHWLADHLTTQERLLEENVHLKTQYFFLQARLQRLVDLEKENTELHALLRSAAQVGGTIRAARVLAVDISSAGLQQLIISAGSSEQVRVGEAVLDAYGVMGQVVKVGPMTSKVLLLTDIRSAIPVKNYRNGVRSVAVGQGNAHRLMLLNVSETADIRVGDLFISSGLGQHYPAGYPVGLVIQKKNIAGGRLAQVILKPLAHLHSTQQVLLVQVSHPQMAAVVAQQLQEPVAGN